MVPAKGAISNLSSENLNEEIEGNSDLCTKFEQALTPEVCEELFDTLAYWNEYLEKDVPGFQELEL